MAFVRCSPCFQRSNQGSCSRTTNCDRFGREDRGLTNEELALANYHLTIPVNSDYGVLNVAQAIQVVCYELRMSVLEQKEVASDAGQMPLAQGQSMQWDEPLVTQQQMEEFYPHLEKCSPKLNFRSRKSTFTTFTLASFIWSYTIRSYGISFTSRYF